MTEMILLLWMLAALATWFAGCIAYSEWKGWKDEPERYKVVRVRVSRFQGAHRRTAMHSPRHAPVGYRYH